MPVAFSQREESPRIANQFNDDEVSLGGEEQPTNDASQLIGGGAPLPRPSTQATKDAAPLNVWEAGSSTTTVAMGLAVVLTLFGLLAVCARRLAPRALQAPPSEVVELLGSTTVGGKRQLQVVKFGSKLVLLSVSADDVSVVSEILDADEVQRLTAICRGSRPGSSQYAFREMLEQLGKESAPKPRRV